MVPKRATTFAIEAENDIEQTVFLLRLSYLYHVSILYQASDTEERMNSTNIDVETEIQKLEFSGELCKIFIQIVSSG